ncbi:hypothetical protein GW17_00060285, partial [Ensete ventricosum]
GAREGDCYKESPGCKLGIKKTGQVSFEYGYQLDLAWFWAEYPDLMVEEDPFTNLPEDKSTSNEEEQPFDDSLPSEN